MKFLKIFSNRATAISARPAATGRLVAVLVAFLGISCHIAVCRAQQPGGDVPGAQVLTRGPVHEAFAGMVTFNPEAGVTVTKAPPDIIEELPPEERPEGDNVSWIPGYWGWDDERSDFLWVSGTWRALPPGREWLAGYWGQTARGYQWTSGYWADASVRETTYLPPPPMTVEVGPNIAAPSPDYGWTPGCWIWYQERYAWRPGYWALCRADWDWTPAHYVYTPRGCIFIGGFWDYPVARRGIVFAPVYFEPAVYSRRGYVYSPTIVISVGVFTDHLFLRPSYQHYYFGDYYAASYVQVGFYASFSFQSGRHGYDPFYSHQRWEHRQDRDWERRVETSYQYRRDNEAARPPRTWAAQRNISPASVESDQNRMLVAAPIEQVAKRKDGNVRFQPVAREERQQLAQRGQEVQKSREQRRTLEAKAAAPTAQKAGEISQPAKVEIPRSPIVAKPTNQFGRNQSPPEAQEAPKPDLKRQPKSESPGHKPKVESSNLQSQPQSRQSEPEKKSAPGRNEPSPREQQPQPKSDRQPEPSQTQIPAAAQPSEKGLEKSVPPESEQRVKKAEAAAQQQLQRNAQDAEKATQAESQRRVKEARAKAQEAEQAKAKGQEKKAQPEPVQRPNNPTVEAAAGSRPSASGLEKPTPRVSAPVRQQKPDVYEKGATRLLKINPRPKGVSPVTASGAEKPEQRPAGEKTTGNGKSEQDPGDNDHNKKPKD